MPAATARLHFQTFCQHEVFRISEKRHKIVEFFALLTTKLSSYKMCKVGMLFCTLQASI